MFCKDLHSSIPFTEYYHCLKYILKYGTLKMTLGLILHKNIGLSVRNLDRDPPLWTNCISRNYMFCKELHLNVILSKYWHSYLKCLWGYSMLKMALSLVVQKPIALRVRNLDSKGKIEMKMVLGLILHKNIALWFRNLDSDQPL